jgi:hypothetical protein
LKRGSKKFASFDDSRARLYWGAEFSYTSGRKREGCQVVKAEALTMWPATTCNDGYYLSFSNDGKYSISITQKKKKKNEEDGAKTQCSIKLLKGSEAIDSFDLELMSCAGIVIELGTPNCTAAFLQSMNYDDHVNCVSGGFKFGDESKSAENDFDDAKKRSKKKVKAQQNRGLARGRAARGSSSSGR